MDELYKFHNYREFLRKAFPGKGDRRGQRQALAETLNCQTSFVSLVLTDRAHFNEDMIFATAHFLNLNAVEKEFLMLIYHHERAASKNLKNHYQSKIKSILEQRKEIKSRVPETAELPIEIQAQFYSSWLYSAVLTAIMNPQIRTLDALSKKLKISERSLAEVLEFLTQWQFVKKTISGYEPHRHRLHLTSQSPFITQHHRNWLLEAMRFLNEKQETDFNYSGAISLSKSDLAAIREILLNAVSNIEKQIAPSPDEEMVGIAISCFKF